MHASLFLLSLLAGRTFVLAAPTVANSLSTEIGPDMNLESLRDVIPELEEQDYDDNSDDDLDDSFAAGNDTSPAVLSANGTSPVSNALKRATLDCTGIEELCDANCYAILCLNRPNTLTKVSTSQAKKNRKAAGASGQPFKGTPEQLRKRGVSRPGANYVSAEEYPFASTSQGGSQADLFPVTVADQNTQARQIRNMYSRYGIKDGNQFRLSINGNTPYCNALRRNDRSVCSNRKDESGNWGFDFGRYAYVKNSVARQGFRYVGK